MESASPSNQDDEELNLLISEVQLVLAEKRTSLSVVRTGIAVLALPLSIVGLLIATSKFYDALAMRHLLTIVFVLCGALSLLGLYLLVRGVRMLRRQDDLVHRLKAGNPRLSRWIP